MPRPQLGHQTKFPRVVVWLSAVVLLCALTWWRGGSAPRAQSSYLVPTGYRAQPSPPPPADTSAGAETGRAGQLREIATYWKAHKAHLWELLTVDYPAAIARRHAAAPDYLAVETFAAASKKDFAARIAKLHFDGKVPDNFPMEKLVHSHLRDLWRPQFVAHDWNDSTPVTENLSIADLTRQMMSDSQKATELRDGLAADERTVFHDEEAARRVEALETGDGLAAYALAAQTRYAAAFEQELDNVGATPGVRDFVAVLSDRGIIASPVEAYLTTHNQEAAALLQEYRTAADAMNEPLLAQASGEDAEARRLLTEWKDLQALKPKAIDDP